MPRFKDQAICIRHLDWSETSEVVVLLTAEQGKIRGLAKGSRRTSPSAIARFSGGIDLLTRGEVVGVIKPNSDLATLTEWDLQDPYRHLHTDLVAQRLAMYAADLVNAILPDHDPHPRAFAELTLFLESIVEDAKRQAALLRFQWNLLEDLGYKPEIEVDARNGEPLPGGEASYTFDARAGGITRQPTALTATAADGVGPWRVRRETVETLRAVAGSGGGEAASGDAALARANRLLCVYARAILDRQLPTMGFVLESGE
jgi:DNA repair protein RecO (recombination protein O)